MRKHTFLFGAVLLLVGGILAKVLGALYKIPLTHILGSNGMGLYYLIFPIYSIVLVVSSGGLSLVLTQFVAKENALKNKINQRRYLIVAILISFCLSLIFSLLILFLADWIALKQGNINANWGYVAIAPAILCSSLITVLKGYYQGKQNMLPSTISVIFEQVFKLLFGLILSKKFLNNGLQFGVLGAVLGVSVSEGLTLICVILTYLFSELKNRKYVANKQYKKMQITGVVKNDKRVYKKSCFYFKLKETKNILSYLKIFKNLIKQSVFSTLSNLVIPLASFIDSFLIINILIKSGFSSTVSTSLYGLSNGIVASLMSLPTMVIATLSTVIIPNLSHVVVLEEKSVFEKKCSFFIKFNWIISILMFIFFILFAKEIITILFSDGLINKTINEFDYAYKLVLVSSVSIIYYGFLQTFMAILNAISKFFISTIALFIGLIIRTLLMIMLTKNLQINVFGSVIANVVFLSIASVICLVFMKKYIELQFGFLRSGVYPIISGVVAFSIIYSLKIILRIYLNIWVYSIICALMCVFIYFILIKKYRVFNKFERDYLNIKFKKISFLTKRIG